MQAKPRTRLLAIMITLGLAPVAAVAHHSPAAYDTGKTVSITGTITRYSFRNPHVYMTLAVTNPDGSTTSVDIEAGASSVIQPLGFTRDAVGVGDQVTINGSPSKRRPDTEMMGRELYREDGSYFPLHIQARSSYQAQQQVAGSLAGTWFAETDDFYTYLNANRNDWALTQQGRDFMAELDYRDTPQKDCIPLAPPTLMLYPVAKTISIHEDRVEFDIDWLDADRVVWTDGREHPEASQTFLLGHSTGHWEDNTLVIDTSNYQPHDMGLSLYLPGSGDKHLTERLTLNPDGEGLTYSGTVTDPAYLEAAVNFSGQWRYRPDMQHSEEACDLETAYEFLKE